MEWLLQPEALIALATLTALEIVLGIDNIVFISILSNKLPAEQQAKARLFGLALAMVTRILLLFSLAWVMQLTTPLFTVLEHAVSGRDLILIGGGLFLLVKSTLEIHGSMNPGEDPLKPDGSVKRVAFWSIIVQIGVLDIVFSLDSVITAVGMTDRLPIMVIAVVIAIVVMMLFAGPISRFVDHNPTIKMLALSFLILIGVMLIGEGFGAHIPKGYIYFAMAFSLAVEMLNMRVRRKTLLASKAPDKPA